MKRRRNLRFFFILIGLFAGLLLLFVQLDRRVMPAALAIAHMEAQNVANRMIDRAVEEAIESMDLSASDLFLYEPSTQSNAFSANTIRINQFCTRLSEQITTELQSLTTEQIDIPMGSAVGIDFLANRGPSLTFTLRPAGAANVDYETSFTSVGINQTNFQIWLETSISIQIVNPLYQEKIVLTRKLMLVNTFLSGQVPDKYFHFGY